LIAELFIYYNKKTKSGMSFLFDWVHPDYQNKAVTAIIFNEYYHLKKKVSKPPGTC
jgi:hypothetical protein